MHPPSLNSERDFPKDLSLVLFIICFEIPKIFNTKETLKWSLTYGIVLHYGREYASTRELSTSLL